MMTNNFVAVNFRELLFLIIAAALFKGYGNDNIEYIELKDDGHVEYRTASGVFTLKKEDFNLKESLSLSDSPLESLSNFISLLLENINIQTFHKIKWTSGASLPNSLYKYVSNKSDYISNFFKEKIAFVHKETFDDIYDCNVTNLFLNDSLVDKMRVLCLSSNNKIDAMWGLYANKSNGLCFSYTSDNILKAIEEQNNSSNFTFVCCNEVFYGQAPEKFDYENTFNEELQKDIDNVKNSLLLCFKKDESWSFEKEYRFIVLGDFSNKDKYFDLKIKPSSYYYKNNNKTGELTHINLTYK